MELFTELLINALENGKIEVTFPDLKLDSAEIVELQSYAALRKIKKILEDHTLDDPECFRKSYRRWSYWAVAAVPVTISGKADHLRKYSDPPRR